MTASRWSRLDATLAGLFTVGLLSTGAAVVVSLPSGSSGPSSVTTMPTPSHPPSPPPLSALRTQRAPQAATVKSPRTVRSPSPTRSKARQSQARTAEKIRAPSPRRPATRKATARVSRAPRPTPSASKSTPPVGSAAFETEVVRLSNAERADAGCAALRPDTRLAEAAGSHSADMALRDYFSHTSPDGLTFVDRARAAGYPSPGGENIAWGQRTPAAVVQDWMNSPGHRRNILNCDFTTIGVGFDRRGHYWTQVFGY